MSLIDSIWEETPYKFETDIFSKLRDEFTKTIHKESPTPIEEAIGKCKSELDLITKFKKYFRSSLVAGDSYSGFKKSAENSTALRERANLSYKTGNVSKALRGYNLAIAFAPVGSSELGLAFGNRSALFLQVNKPRLALRDITLALENNFPPNLSDRLCQRQEKCVKLLTSEAEINQLNEEDRLFCEENYFKLKNPHKNIPNAEDWVDVLFEADRGRKVVATKDIPAGTLILIDKPWVSVINNLLLWNLQYCHFCSQPIMNGIPCDFCTFTFYCDDECKINSCEGPHKYEHHYLPFLHSIESHLTHKDLMALRIIGRLGPDQLELYMKQSDLLHPPKQIKGFDEKNVYNSDSYLPIYHLISHNSKVVQETLSQILKSLLYTQLLKETTDFFSGRTEALEDFAASLIFKHVSNIRYNAISITHLKSSANGGEVSLSYAAALYPLLSLCNHSCDPNAVPVKKFKHLETSLVTLKNLKAGQEIFITYKPLFTQMKTSERQEYLRSNYQFSCSCPPCVNNWSLKSVRQYSPAEVEVAGEKFLCKKCAGKRKNKSICRDCLEGGMVQSKILDDFEAKLHESDEEIKNGNYRQAITKLMPCLVHFTHTERNEYFPSLNSLTQVSLELYKRALLRIVYKAQNFESFPAGTKNQIQLN